MAGKRKLRKRPKMARGAEMTATERSCREAHQIKINTLKQQQYERGWSAAVWGKCLQWSHCLATVKEKHWRAFAEWLAVMYVCVCVSQVLRCGENGAQFGLLLPGKRPDSCLELGGVLLGKLSHQQSHFVLGVCVKKKIRAKKKEKNDWPNHKAGNWQMQDTKLLSPPHLHPLYCFGPRNSRHRRCSSWVSQSLKSHNRN